MNIEAAIIGRKLMWFGYVLAMKTGAVATNTQQGSDDTMREGGMPYMRTLIQCHRLEIRKDLVEYERFINRNKIVAD